MTKKRAARAARRAREGARPNGRATAPASQRFALHASQRRAAAAFVSVHARHDHAICAKDDEEDDEEEDEEEDEEDEEAGAPSSAMSEALAASTSPKAALSEAAAAVARAASAG
jgi:hypothetical protein